jgi:hypothetical protein
MEFNDDNITEELLLLKEGLITIENKITEAIKEKNLRKTNFSTFDNYMDNFSLKLLGKNHLIRLNVGGRVFKAYLHNFLKHRNSFFELYFYRLMIENGAESNFENAVEKTCKDEHFIDRNSEYFDMVLEYILTDRINSAGHTSENYHKMKEEFNFYGLENALTKIYDQMSCEVFVVNFSANRYQNTTPYSLEGLRGDNEDIANPGIVVGSPFVLTFELETPATVRRIEIEAWHNSAFTGVNKLNLRKCEIMSSLDGVKYQNIGKIDNSYDGEHLSMAVKETNAKYIRLKCTKIFGVSYFRVFTGF